MMLRHKKKIASKSHGFINLSQFMKLKTTAISKEEVKVKRPLLTSLWVVVRV